MTKTVYGYDERGVYMGEEVLDESHESPLEPGVYHIPAYCTEIEPPEEVEGMVRVFDGDTWHYEPRAEIDPEQARMALLSRLPSLREAYLEDGFKFRDNWFRSDVRNKLTYLSLVAIEDSLPEDYKVMTITGEEVLLGYGGAKYLLAAFVNHEQSIMAAAEKHRKALETTNDPVNYDLSTGWPQTFSTHREVPN